MNLFKIKSVLFSSIIQISCSLSCTQSATAPDKIAKKPIKNVLLDLGGVLVETSRSGLGSKLGCVDCIRYTLFNFKNPSNLKEIAFKLLDTIAEPQKAPNGSKIAMADELPMPGLMCRWMCGTITGPEIIQLVNKEIDAGNCDSFFGSATEKRLISRLIGAIFDPATLATYTHPIKKGVELLESCSQREDLTLMLLSNYAADAFEELYNRTEAQKIFKYFSPEKMIVSGLIGTMKPYGSIYEYLKKEYHLDPAECVVIDDQEENIEAAKKAGFETVFIKNGNFAQARRELVEMGVLS